MPRKKPEPTHGPKVLDTTYGKAKFWDLSLAEFDECYLMEYEYQANQTLKNVKEIPLPKTEKQRESESQRVKDTRHSIGSVRHGAKSLLREIALLRHHIERRDMANALFSAVIIGINYELIKKFWDQPDTNVGYRSKNVQKRRVKEQKKLLSPRDQFMRDTANTYREKHINPHESAVANHVLYKLNEPDEVGTALYLRKDWRIVDKRQVLRIIKPAS